LEGLGDFVENAHCFISCDCGNPLAGKGHLPSPEATIQNTMPFQGNCFAGPEWTANFRGMTQLRSVFAVSEVKNA
jgi:hypothetical protein